MTKFFLLFTLTAFVLLTPSCLFTRQNQRYYVLVPETNGTAQTTYSDCILENVRLPSFLDRHEISYLADTGEVVRLSKAKWAQSLGTLVKENLTSAVRQRIGTPTDTPAVAMTVILDQFWMTADGTFLVAGFIELRSLSTSDSRRKPFAFQLPSLGQPSVELVVTQTRTALNKILDELAHAKE